MKHDEIERLLLYATPETGEVWATEKHNPGAKSEFVFSTFKPMRPRYATLFTAAPMMYQALTQQAASIREFIALIERSPGLVVNDDWVNVRTALLKMQAGCQLAQLVALEGVDKALAKINNGECDD